MEEHWQRRRAELWTEAQQAGVNLTTKHTPQQARIIRRIHADMEALNAESLYLSAERMRQLNEVANMRDLVRGLEEQQHLVKAYIRTTVRSACLSIFAPLGDVGVGRPLKKLFTLTVTLPRITFFPGVFVAASMPSLRLLAALPVQEEAESDTSSTNSKGKREK